MVILIKTSSRAFLLSLNVVFVFFKQCRFNGGKLAGDRFVFVVEFRIFTAVPRLIETGSTPKCLLIRQGSDHADNGCDDNDEFQACVVFYTK